MQAQKRGHGLLEPPHTRAAPTEMQRAEEVRLFGFDFLYARGRTQGWQARNEGGGTACMHVCVCGWGNITGFDAHASERINIYYALVHTYMWNLFSRIVPEKRPRGACVILFCNAVPKWVMPKWHMPPTDGLMHLRSSRIKRHSKIERCNFFMLRASILMDTRLWVTQALLSPIWFDTLTGWLVRSKNAPSARPDHPLETSQVFVGEKVVAPTMASDITAMN
jgi:hypothetical protein